MQRWFFALVLAALTALTARAHFIWIVPDDKGAAATAIFSDSLEPDNPKLLAKIAHTELFVPAVDGKRLPIKWTEGKDAFLVTPPDKAAAVTGVCNYGVIERGGSEPFLLKYTATASLQPVTTAGGLTGLAAPDSKLDLALRAEPNSGGLLQLQVLWQGKPLADAEVVALVPGEEKTRELKSDKKGLVDLGQGQQTHKPGLYGVRVKHVEATPGEHQGKKYKEVRQYATLTFRVAGTAKAAAAPTNQKEEPAASKLLQEARAARAQWKDFPGFTAAAEVNFDGKVSKGQVTVDGSGKVRFENLDKTQEAWARRSLASTVSHRLDDSSSLNTPCAFLDENAQHPLGRAIRVLNDELHSSYRIRDKQIMEVNRQMKDARFSISVLENRPNAEGKFLSVAFVISFWNGETGNLERTEAHNQTWQRVGKFDLPVTTTVVASSKEGAKDSSKQAQTLTLSNHRLLDAAGK